MKKIHAISVGFALLLGAPTAATTAQASEATATARHVHGIITSVSPDTLSIASMQSTVTGRIDPARTKVKINGHAAKLADLKVTAHAKAELCLDDVWLVIDAH
jgi:hypothetical protein